LHQTCYIVVFVEVEDVADVTAILPTTVVEAGHDVVRALSEVRVLLFLDLK
jgi:hypothetical protein